MITTPALFSLIRGLHHPDAPRRRRAAREIFRRGSELVCPVLDTWLRDPELPRVAGFGLARGKWFASEITVGLAVERPTFARIRAANGSPRLARVPPEHDAIEFELAFPKWVRLSIVAPRRPQADGAIARYLKKFGEGIQQIELRVRDVDRASEILGARFGLEPVYPAARPGADASRVNFFLVPAPHGKKVLIELAQSPRLSSRA